MKTFAILLLAALPALAAEDRIFLRSAGNWTNATKVLAAASKLEASESPKDKAAGRALLLELAEAGNAEAAVMVSYHLTSYPQAVQLLGSHARKGNVTAQKQLAVAALKARNETAAFGWYQMAANQGDTDSQVRVAKAYATGMGVARDWSRAQAMFEKAEDFIGIADHLRSGTAEHYKWVRVAQLRGRQSMQERLESLANYPPSVIAAGEQAAVDYVKRRWPETR